MTPWPRKTLTPFCLRCPMTLRTSWMKSLWRLSDWWRTRNLWWAGTRLRPCRRKVSILLLSFNNWISLSGSNDPTRWSNRSSDRGPDYERRCCRQKRYVKLSLPLTSLLTYCTREAEATRLKLILLSNSLCRHAVVFPVYFGPINY